MTCSEWQEKIDRYLDSETPNAEAREVEVHLRECSSCSAQALALSQLKRSIHVAGQAFSPDAEFRKRVRSSIQPKPAGLRWNWLLGAAAIAAVMLIAFGSMLWTQRAERQRMLGELTDLHVTTLASANRVDVVSSDRHTVKPWFQGKLPFTFDLPDLQGSSFELLGGKMAYFEQDAGAELLFGVRKHLVSVFIFKDSPALQRALSSGELTRKLSFNIAAWTDAGLCYAIVTDASPSDVEELRARFRTAAAQ